MGSSDEFTVVPVDLSAYLPAPSTQVNNPLGIFETRGFSHEEGHLVARVISRSAECSVNPLSISVYPPREFNPIERILRAEGGKVCEEEEEKVNKNGTVVKGEGATLGGITSKKSRASVSRNNPLTMSIPGMPDLPPFFSQTRSNVFFKSENYRNIKLP